MKLGAPNYKPAGAGGTVAVSSAAIGITPANIPAGTTHVDLTACVNDMTYRYDGSDPSATVGKLLSAGSTDTLPVEMVLTAKFIRVSADGTLLWQPLRAL